MTAHGVTRVANGSGPVVHGLCEGPLVRRWIVLGGADLQQEAEHVQLVVVLDQLTGGEAIDVDDADGDSRAARLSLTEGPGMGAYKSAACDESLPSTR